MAGGKLKTQKIGGVSRSHRNTQNDDFKKTTTCVFTPIIGVVVQLTIIPIDGTG
jgi:hypothetical protein